MVHSVLAIPTQPPLRPQLRHRSPFNSRRCLTALRSQQGCRSQCRRTRIRNSQALSPKGPAPPLVWQQTQAAQQAALARRRRQASTRLPVACRRIGPRLRLQEAGFGPACCECPPVEVSIVFTVGLARRQDPQNRRETPKIEVDRLKLSPPQKTLIHNKIS